MRAEVVWDLVLFWLLAGGLVVVLLEVFLVVLLNLVETDWR